MPSPELKRTPLARKLVEILPAHIVPQLGDARNVNALAAKIGPREIKQAKERGELSHRIRAKIVAAIAEQEGGPIEFEDGFGIRGRILYDDNSDALTVKALESDRDEGWQTYVDRDIEGELSEGALLRCGLQTSQDAYRWLLTSFLSSSPDIAEVLPAHLLYLFEPNGEGIRDLQHEIQSIKGLEELSEWDLARVLKHSCQQVLEKWSEHGEIAGIEHYNYGGRWHIKIETSKNTYIEVSFGQYDGDGTTLRVNDMIVESNGNVSGQSIEMYSSQFRPSRFEIAEFNDINKINDYNFRQNRVRPESDATKKSKELLLKILNDSELWEDMAFRKPLEKELSLVQASKKLQEVLPEYLQRFALTPASKRKLASRIKPEEFEKHKGDDSAESDEDEDIEKRLLRKCSTQALCEITREIMEYLARVKKQGGNLLHVSTHPTGSRLTFRQKNGDIVRVRTGVTLGRYEYLHISLVERRGEKYFGPVIMWKREGNETQLVFGKNDGHSDPFFIQRDTKRIITESDEESDEEIGDILLDILEDKELFT